ncbi:MAG: hypothetical protein K2Y32_16575 [Candidatus Obscuribacterales bacterium]|nr:hypothetical protein [Candidatus Obscuribacterales bacterium]
MSIEAAFDIQQLKNSSMKRKNALQAEWQETIELGRSSDSVNAMLVDLTLSTEETASFPSMLPNVVLALNYRNRNLSSQAKTPVQNGPTSIVPVSADKPLSMGLVSDWTH